MSPVSESRESDAKELQRPRRPMARPRAPKQDPNTCMLMMRIQHVT